MGVLALKPEEKEEIFEIIEKITGTYQQGKYRRKILATNVARRITAAGFDNLEEYLKYTWSNKSEMAEFVSALTIHTTNWFRENKHYIRLEDHLVKGGFKLSNEKFKLLSAASSSGEEAYSFGLVLEHFRNMVPGFDYEIVGRDIDPISVAAANRGIYKINDDIAKIKSEFQRFLLKGSGKTSGFFTLDKEIRDRTRFEVRSLTELQPDNEEQFDWVVCRNVLIYFKPDDVDVIIRRILAKVKPKGMLVLGSAEAIDPQKFGLSAAGTSCYFRKL
ncbi:MAG: CheR family methyltransferase [Pseudomonadota bacterium]|nr:CheR family methyltransferase [Pseudomonadota bacterium]